MKPKLLAIVGPTATGKTALALKLAKKFHGEIISADSRAVYRGLDIGTAKPPGKWTTRRVYDRILDIQSKNKAAKKNPIKHSAFVYRGIVFHLVDFLSLQKTFSAADFAEQARKAISEIQNRGRLPIICGGTGFWIEVLLSPGLISSVKPDLNFRKRMREISVETLFVLLKQLDPGRAKTIDLNNRRRLIRALEIASHRLSATNYKLPTTNYPVLYLGLTLPNALLKKRIHARFLKWLRMGLLAETKKLLKLVSKKRLSEIGLAYPIVAEYLAGKLTKTQMIERATNAIYHYAKRQKTWFKKNPHIHWVTPSKQTERLVAKFIQ